MKRRRGGKQIGNRRAGHREPAAVAVDLREQPVAGGGADRHGELMQQRDRRGGRGHGALAHPAHIAPRAVGGVEEFQALHHAQRIGQFRAEILVRAERDEAAVGIAVRRAGLHFVAAVGGAECFQPREDRIGKAVRRFFRTDRRPAPCERAEMHEVERSAVAEAVHKRPDFFNRKLRLQRLQPREHKDRVVKIRPSCAIRAAALGRDLPDQEIPHELRGIAERLLRDACDLQHLKTEAHARSVAVCARGVKARSRACESAGRSFFPATRADGSVRAFTSATTAEFAFHPVLFRRAPGFRKDAPVAVHEGEAVERHADRLARLHKFEPDRPPSQI